MPKEKDQGDLARWAVLIFVIIPMLPIVIIAFTLGMAWALAKGAFEGGANILSVWDNYDQDEPKP